MFSFICIFSRLVKFSVLFYTPLFMGAEIEQYWYVPADILVGL